MKIETAVARNRKFVIAGPAPAWLWLCGVAYCKESLTDGFIPEEALPFLGVKNAKQLAQHLVLAKLWDKTEGGFHVHDYLEHNADAETIKGHNTKRAENGAKGGRLKPRLKTLGSPESSRSESSQGDQSHKDGTGLRERFEQFWGEYPRKTGKDAAWREWLKRSPSDDLTARMIAKVREQRSSREWLKDDGQFIPHPRTWLHQGRWKDEPASAASQAPDWYGHVPRCRNEQECTKRFLSESKAETP